MKKCPYCNAQMKDDSYFCANCGKEYLQVRYCPQCGAELSGNAVFCPKCGAKLSDYKTNSQTDSAIKNAGSYQYQGKKKSSSSKIVIPIIAVLVLVLAGVGGWLYLNLQGLNSQQNLEENNIIKERVEEIYDKILEYQNSRDYIPNYEEQFLSSEFNKLYNEAEELAERFDDLLMDSNMWTSQDSDRPSIEVVNVKKTADKEATVDFLYKIYYNEDYKEERTLSLVKENNEWVIDDFIQSDYKPSLKQYLKEHIDFYKKELAKEADISNSQSDVVSMSFLTEQYVYGYLANKSFRHSSGLVIKFNGDCQVYIDGDWVAGTFAVLRYDSMNAYIQFNSPTYGTKHLLAKINGDEIELVDTSDGAVYWQIK